MGKHVTRQVTGSALCAAAGATGTALAQQEILLAGARHAGETEVTLGAEASLHQRGQWDAKKISGSPNCPQPWDTARPVPAHESMQHLSFLVKIHLHPRKPRALQRPKPG